MTTLIEQSKLTSTTCFRRNLDGVEHPLHETITYKKMYDGEKIKMYQITRSNNPQYIGHYIYCEMFDNDNSRYAYKSFTKSYNSDKDFENALKRIEKQG